MTNLPKLSQELLIGVFLSLILSIGVEVHPQQSINDSEIALAKPSVYCWDYLTDKITTFPVASDNKNNLFIQFLDGKLILIDAQSSKKIWETALGGKFIAASLFNEGSIYTIVNYDLNPAGKNIPNEKRIPSIIRSIDNITGITNWETGIFLSGSAYLIIYKDSLIVTNNKGEIYSIDKNSGHINWNKSLKFELTFASNVKSDKLVLGGTDGYVYILSSDSGRILQKVQVFALPTTGIIDQSGKNLIWGDEKGTVTSFNIDSKIKNWSVRKGAKILSIKVTAEGLLISCLDNFIYLMSVKSGKLLWKKRLAGRSLANPFVTDGFAIIVLTDEPIASVIDLKTSKFIKNIELKDGDLFTSNFTRVGNVFVYSTLRGISAVSLEGKCPSQHK